ncbi:MAG: hypothetical protein HY316_00685 [Acidobacteria bacterium]|nr:hypothetical protein [Acidobacteriota bacterium]
MAEKTLTELLEKLIDAGFSLRSLPAYPRHLATEKYNFVALLEWSKDNHWRQFSAAGLLIDGQIALLMARDGQSLFICKTKEIPADDAMMGQYHQFQHELENVLVAHSNPSAAMIG